MLIYILTFLFIIPVVRTDPFSPSFSENIYTIKVSESRAIISQLLTIIATDSDLPLFYEQTSNFPEFEVTSDGILNLIQTLDRESVASYQINVKVTDTTGRSSSTVVFVTVSDVNDNSPVFSNTVLQHTLAENSPVGTSLLTIVATDADSGTNGFVTFSLSTNPDDTFMISDVTGTFSLKTALDFEVTTHYHVVVVATDSGASPRSTLTSISVTVTDSDDLVPVFTMTSYSVVIDEHSTSTSVVTVLAIDSDQGVGHTINYAIESGNDGNAFTIGLLTGTIAVFSSNSIDREIHPTPFILTIKAFEAQNSIQSAFVLVTIELLDINDQPPVFVGGPFTGSVAENSLIGYSVVTAISASDSDLGDNALFSFGIEASSDPGVFTINSETGEVIVSGDLDRETQDSYTFNVMVFDTSGAPLSSIASVTIDITDVNDNSPVFAADTFSLNVLEEQSADLFIVSITATDVDLGLSGIVAYSLTGLFANRFSVSTDGTVTTRAVLDREGLPSYEINLVASDMDPIDPRQSVALLIITVDDVNDQDPFFTPLSLSVDVIETVTVPHQLITVSASDSDIGTNADISYSLVSSSNTGNHFSIAADTGLISVTTALNREANSFFTLQIIATDTGSRTGTGTVLVTVIDANTQDPVFSSSLYQATLSESSAVDTSVLQVGASDTDIGANAIISFSLIQSDDSSYFKIDSKFGHISIANSLDAETQSDYEFEVTAEDNGSPPRSATSLVQISVTDSNDNPPIFTPTLYTDSVLENIATSATIRVLTATDLDIETINNQLTYSIVSQTPNQNRFSILPESGAVILRTSLNREDTFFYTIIVESVDIGGLSDTATLQITVTDVNDNSPIFSMDIYSFNYLENDVIGTKLGTVTATDQDEPNTLNSELSYSIIGGDSIYFSINPTSGEITSTQEIDREATPSLTLNVLVSDSGTTPLTDTSVVNINIVDVNDNSPVFDQASYSADVPEGTVVDVSVAVVSVTDMDDGINSEVRFEITGGNILSHFSINTLSGEIKTTSTPLDRETISTFQLTITATDSGTPSRQATTQLNVIVTDINDNKPVFTQTAFFIELIEDSSINLIIEEVSAVDVDLLLSGSVIYEMVTATSFFSVDSISGEVALTSNLDRELTNIHIIEIQAVDAGVTPLTSDTNVVMTISVTDANDNMPLFSPTPATPVSVSEGESVGFLVDTYVAIDSDIGANAVVTFVATGGEGGFEVDRVTGQLKIASQLDRETKDNYVLEIFAIDGGPTPLSSVATVIINIGDTNDNAPTFTPSTPLSVNIKENLDIGQAVATITATDTDLGANSVLVYSIISSQPASGFNTFTIDDVSGQITVNFNDIDRETIDSYILTILVSDSGTVPLSDTLELEVLVTDVNDENPTFSQGVYTETILESRGVNTVVLIVSASDNDDSDNNVITYSIDGPESVNFQINSQTGEISTTNTFDFELKILYTFTVTGIDNGVVTRQGTAEIRVTIADVNDNRPSLQPTSYTTQLYEDESVGYVVLTVLATDEDSTINAVVKFEKISGSADFLIDFDTGEVKIARALNREMTSSYSITVRGVDQGFPQLDSDPLIIEIEVLDVNDNNPEFIMPLSTIYIPEDTMVTMVVAQFFASDLDADQNADIVFTLTGSDLFTIDPTTGEVKVAQNLDRENTDIFELTVTISDNGISSLSAQTNLIIHITDVNDNTPVFDTSIDTTISLREDTIVGQIVLNTPATDNDIAPNNIITYMLVDSDPITGLTTFGIDENIGELFIAINDIDRELIGQYILKIEALDSGLPTLTANLIVTITITDFNDNTPIFTLQIFEISISESTLAVTSIYRFFAADNDIGVNEEFDFSIEESVDFSVDTTSGELFTINTFDFETTTSYTFVIIATDRGVPPLASQKSVTVIITDANDNPPILSDTIYSKGLLEEFTIGGTIFIFSATDKDSELFGKVNFELVGVFSEFKVDLENGILSSVGLFTGQVGRTFDFQIRAFDNEGVTPTQFDIENIHIVIIAPEYVVEMVLNRSPDFVTVNQHEIEGIFTQALEANVIIDEITPFYDSSNFIDPAKSNVDIHATDLTTNTLIDGLDLLRAVDEKESVINDLLFTAGIQLAEPVITKDTTLISTELALIIVSVILLLFISCCGCILCLLVIRIYRLRRRKQQYAKSYASLSTYFPSQSNMSTEMHSLTNPLYISPYGESSLYEKAASLKYESQELTMELFTQDFESFGGQVSVVDLFENSGSGLFGSLGGLSDEEVSRVLVDFGSEDGSGISVI